MSTFAAATGFLARSGAANAFTLEAQAEAFDLSDASKGLVRAWHASPDAPAVDIGPIAGTSISPAFAGAAYPKATDPKGLALAPATLPLGVTPSGGARNPFEAYVIIRRSSEISPGIYHYSAVEHSLGRVDQELPERLNHLFANQEWVDDMSVIVVLTAIFERTMWKYEDPNAYRVVLIEAGHIAQNIMLAATDQGLSACPTAALSHTGLRDLFGLEEMTHVPLYALTLDKPMPYPDKVRAGKATHQVNMET